MADNKPTTAEILALCREQDGGDAPIAAAPADTPAPEPVAETMAADAPEPTESPAASAPAGGPPPTFGDRPKSTADILAAARAESTSAGAAGTSAPPDKPKPPEKPAAKPAPAAAAGGATPGSTKDILAAARAQAGGGSAAPAAASSKPKGTSDILAAARAQAGAAGGAAKPAAKAAAKPAAAAKTGDGSRPSVNEMLKAVREDKPAADAEKKKPQLPQRPAPSKVRAVDKPKRRNFLVAMFSTPFALAWTSFVTASAAAGLGMARFMLPNATVEPPSKFKVGIPEDYPFGTVTTKWKSEFAIWMTHQVYNGKTQIYALSTVCTHLGCTPNWLEGEQKFKCPCHGSGFYGDGINFEGPAPRPLERYAIKVAADGQLEVDKSQKFQEEMGQWTDPASFVATTS